MNAPSHSFRGRALVLASLFGAAGFGAAGCSGGGGGGSGGMSIVQCSLQCTDSAGNPGAQISCGVTDVFVNQEIQIRFTNPVDLLTVSNNSFQMVELGTGKTPPGSFSLLPGDPEVLVYRPQLTFDSAGNPIFGLTADQTYFLKVPGTTLDPLGPYIRNEIGTANTSRMQCRLVASLGVFDAKPGRPRVSITVHQVTGYDPDGEPSEFAFNIPAQGAVDVWRASPVRMVFDDVMNPATLANPVTGQSSFIRALIDADGDLTDPSDQVDLAGSYTLTIDQTALKTTVVFTPAGGLPSAGANPPPRKVVMELSPQIADLGGNALLNPGTTSFTPEKIVFEPLVIGEPFADPAREDSVRTGSAWGGGILATGPGGGSGRLGDLIVPAGRVVELDTDSEDFADLTDPQVFNPANVIDRPAVLEITDGIFEFARLRVDAGGVLRLRGTNPARIYVRGECVIQGLIDVSGQSGTLQRSDEPSGGSGGLAGPNGGAGGDGGFRPDGTNFRGTFMGVSIGGVANPGVGPSDVLDPATYLFVNGLAGGGIAFPDTIAPAEFVAGGGGGLAWPQPTLEFPDLHMPAEVLDVGGLPVDPWFWLCSNPVPSAPGGGGGHALSGVAGVPRMVDPGGLHDPTFPPPAAVGGDSGELEIDDLVRSLSPELGLLRGGGGGGGGGAHLQMTRVNGRSLDTCSVAVPSGSALQVMSYIAHSSAGGGGGGGGLQVAAGRRLLLNGVIDASGGIGGSGTFPPNTTSPNDLAQAGGGGASGSVLLQSQVIQIQAIPNRIDIRGGEGGEGTGSPYPVEPSRGGLGSPGFLRMEALVAPVVANEESKVQPLESELQEDFGSTVRIEDIFTTAVWAPPVDAPSGWSGAQSCWIRPSGNFFKLQFVDDTDGPGWDMNLRIAGQAEPQSFRGDNDLFPPGTTLEEVFGSDFGGAPVVVRFQGARAVDVLIDPCAVPESGIASPLRSGSLTDWLRHTAELNDFFADDSLSPNIFRFVILWDRSQPEFAQIEGVEDITVTIQPD